MDLRWLDSFLPTGSTGRAPPYSVLCLNYTFPAFSRTVIENATALVCTDGGTDRFLQWRDAHPGMDRGPQYVVGDLDSSSAAARDAVAALGGKVVETPDQDHSDFEKAFAFIDEVRPVVVLGGLGGRRDHELLHMSFLLAHPARRIFLLGADGACCTTVPPGVSTVSVPASAQRGSLGLFPLLRPAVVSTHGLAWDLAGARLAMGEFVSSSNDAPSGTFEVTTTEPLLLAFHLAA